MRDRAFDSRLVLGTSARGRTELARARPSGQSSNPRPLNGRAFPSRLSHSPSRRLCFVLFVTTGCSSARRAARERARRSGTRVTHGPWAQSPSVRVGRVVRPSVRGGESRGVSARWREKKNVSIAGDAGRLWSLVRVSSLRLEAPRRLRS